jgi:hypothetical protein
MPLSAELQDLKSRCAQALQMGASLGRIDTHLAKVGAKAAAPGVSKEQHLMNTLCEMEGGATSAPEPQVEESTDASTEASEETPRARRRR